MIAEICIVFFTGYLFGLVVARLLALSRERRGREAMTRWQNRLQDRLSVLITDNRHDCMAPQRIITEVNSALGSARAALHPPPWYDAPTALGRIRESAIALGQADALLEILSDDVYPLIGRWRKADADLLRAMWPFVLQFLTNRQPPADGNEVAAVRNKLDAIWEIAAVKPRVGLEQLTSLVEDLARTPRKPVKPPSG